MSMPIAAAGSKRCEVGEEALVEIVCDADLTRAFLLSRTVPKWAICTRENCAQSFFKHVARN